MRFYRIVLTDPPTLADFLSAAAQGRPARRNDPETLRLWTGISVYETFEQARDKALDFPMLGHLIATLDIPEHTLIRAERTTSSRGHHTLWGEPADLLAHVVSIADLAWTS